jgi:hypothetical protein
MEWLKGPQMSIQAICVIRRANLVLFGVVLSVFDSSIAVIDAQGKSNMD